MIQLNLRITKAQLRRLQAQQQGDEQVQQTAIRLLFPYLTEPAPAPLAQPQGDDPMDY